MQCTQQADRVTRMAPQGFMCFIMRRVRCTTLFFLALFAVMFTATSAYYVVRINVIERHLRTRALKAAEASRSDATGGMCATTDPSATSAHERDSLHDCVHHPLLPSATPAEQFEFVRRLRRSTAAAYVDLYKLLVVNTPMSRQTVRNPTLPESIPVWEDMAVVKEGEFTAEQAAPRVRVPPRQRYVLAGLEAGKHYMLRLSFLGSPSVGFEMLLYQVPQVQLEALLGKNGHGEEEVHGTDAAGWATVPQDTELRVFAMSATNALQFDYEEEVWVDESLDDAGAAEEADLGTSTIATPARHTLVDERDEWGRRYVPVVEVRPRALSIPFDTSRLPVVRYNIVVEQLSSSFLPQIAVPLITYGAWVVVFMGYLCIYTFVSSGVAGGRPHED